MNIFVQEVGGELVKTRCTSSPPVLPPVGRRHDPKRSMNTALFAIKFPRTTVISYVLFKQNGWRRAVEFDFERGRGNVSRCRK